MTARSSLLWTIANIIATKKQLIIQCQAAFGFSSLLTKIQASIISSTMTSLILEHRALKAWRIDEESFISSPLRVRSCMTWTTNPRGPQKEVNGLKWHQTFMTSWLMFCLYSLCDCSYVAPHSGYLCVLQWSCICASVILVNCMNIS